MHPVGKVRRGGKEREKGCGGSWEGRRQERDKEKKRKKYQERK